jgi:hypothetical protein
MLDQVAEAAGGGTPRQGLPGSSGGSGAALHVLDEFPNLITVLVAGDGDEAQQGSKGRHAV